MRHLVSGRKLNRTKSHRNAMFNNMATSLFEHKRICTTEIKAKELRPFAEALITKAKHALVNERQKLLPNGQTIDIHNRRIVARHIHDKAVLQELFDAIAPAVENRNGGYTRIIKTGIRRGDAGRTAIIELVDWSAAQDGTIASKPKKKIIKKSDKKVKTISNSEKVVINKEEKKDIEIGSESNMISNSNVDLVANVEPNEIAENSSVEENKLDEHR